MFASLNQSLLLSLYTFTASYSLTTDLAIFFAEWFPYLVIISVLLYEIYAQDKEHKIVGAVVRTLIPSLLVWFSVMLFKYVYPAARPFAADLGITPLVGVTDPFGSFPSAHAAVFGALAGAMLGNRFHGWKWYLLSALMIAIARVATGVHWPVDVIVGLCFGFVVGFLITRPLAMMRK